jgi:hypothetical protein
MSKSAFHTCQWRLEIILMSFFRNHFKVFRSFFWNYFYVLIFSIVVCGVDSSCLSWKLSLSVKKIWAFISAVLSATMSRFKWAKTIKAFKCSRQKWNSNFWFTLSHFVGGLKVSVSSWRKWSWPNFKQK